MDGDRDVDGELLADLLSDKWLLIKWPAAKALIRDSSPAKTVAATTEAKRSACLPGCSEHGPLTPRMLRQEL